MWESKLRLSDPGLAYLKSKRSSVFIPHFPLLSLSQLESWNVHFSLWFENAVTNLHLPCPAFCWVGGRILNWVLSPAIKTTFRAGSQAPALKLPWGLPATLNSRFSVLLGVGRAQSRNIHVLIIPQWFLRTLKLEKHFPRYSPLALGSVSFLRLPTHCVYVFFCKEKSLAFKNF